MSRTVLITGASSGIGRATALELLRAGHTVYGGARRVESLDAVTAAGGHALAMDVTSDEDRRRAVRTVLGQQGRIDVLVNNAGFGLYGAAEDVPLDQARYQLEVNLFGPARLIQLVLPHLRRQRSGTIVNVSSMGGEITFPLGAWYHASKHALEAYSDALRQEVRRFGVDVVLVQPGLIRTEFGDVTAGEVRELSGHGPYHDLAEGLATSTEALYREGGRASDPSVVAATIRKAVESSSPKPRYPVGYMARPLLALNRFLPARLFDRVASSQLS
ncbi:MAG TPA: oxidoreductase [Actinomycetes bacterium]|nr:oxidoreductase [Actinomycetes bacterium]